MAKEKTITGRWLIDSMEAWDREFIDAAVRGFFDFSDKHLGSFQFGYVQGEIDYRIGERDGELKGMFYFHLGDESGIVLKRRPGARKGRKP